MQKKRRVCHSGSVDDSNECLAWFRKHVCDGGTFGAPSSSSREGRRYRGDTAEVIIEQLCCSLVKEVDISAQGL